MQALEPLAGEELERQLARYARVRLDPTPAQSRRARAAILEAAWRRRLDAPAGARAARRWRGPFATWGARRVAASLTAAVLAGLLVGSTAFAASRAGGPLYEARLSFEALTLPSDPDARLEAELAQAQSRLAELVDASERDDEGAIVAAVAAYERSLGDLEALTGDPADRAMEAVEFHRTVLLRLLATVPAPALSGLENALEHSSGVIDRLDAAGGTGTGGPGPAARARVRAVPGTVRAAQKARAGRAPADPARNPRSRPPPSRRILARHPSRRSRPGPTTRANPSPRGRPRATTRTRSRRRSAGPRTPAERISRAGRAAGPVGRYAPDCTQEEHACA